MKKIKLLSFVFLIALLTSCSSDDGNGDNSGPFTQFFEHSFEGQEINITQWQAVKSENNLEVLGTSPDGSSISVSFNKFGNVNDISTTSAISSSDPWMFSYYNYSSNYIDFELVSIDEVNKRVEVNYSGKVYEDAYNITSSFSNIEGSFHVNYVEATPQLSGLQFTAKLQGQDWHSVKSVTSRIGSGLNDYSLQHASDDEYVLSLKFNHETTNEGVYNFSSSAESNKVVLLKYNTTSHEYIEYECAGTLDLTEKTSLGFFYLVEGTFSFTATNPDDNTQIQVTNGVFKDIYTY